MATLSSQHHSFDTLLASKYGVHGALLIHHFQHWVRVNRRQKRNLIEGRTWTYQTYSEIAAHFPYLTYKMVRRIVDKLEKAKVLIKGNFNHRKGDQTIWFAFVDEEKFVVPIPYKDEMVYEEMPERAGVCPNGQGSAQTGRALPDTKTDTLNTYLKEKENKEKEIGGEPPGPPSASPPHSPSARVLFDLFLGKIKERNSEFKDPNTDKWLKDFDKLLRIDKRDLERTKQLILWASTHKWWSIACLSPGKVRKFYDEMLMQMQGQLSQSALDAVVKANREHVAEIQKRFPEKVRGLKIYQKYVAKEGTAKEVYFNLPQETFRAAFLGLFRGGYEG